MVDVIIPVYKPTEYLLSILLMLKRQTVVPNKVILINTEEEYWNKFFGDFDILTKYPFIELHHIKKEEFDHAGTRNLGVSYSDAEFFLLMTDDAVPDNEYMIENMLKAFEDERIGTCYARQLPHKGCRAIEKYTRTFNYPNKTFDKGKEQIETMGIKAFFMSDVCCMYRRKVFDFLNGFQTPAIFNEDMIFARRMIENDYLIRYCAEAKVCHSHNYSGVEQLRRNFDLGVSQADHPEIFADVKAEGEGMKLVKGTCQYLCKKLMPWMIIRLVYMSGMKYIGFKMGQNYKKLPKNIVLKITSNKGYFDIKENVQA